MISYLQAVDKLADKLQANFVAPKTSVEKQLTKIWKDLLRVNQVGIHDNFYAIGGDSLSTTSMVIEIEDRFNTEISVESFLRLPTIETITKLIQGWLSFFTLDFPTLRFLHLRGQLIFLSSFS